MITQSISKTLDKILWLPHDFLDGFSIFSFMFQRLLDVEYFEYIAEDVFISIKLMFYWIIITSIICKVFAMRLWFTVSLRASLVSGLTRQSGIDPLIPPRTYEDTNVCVLKFFFFNVISLLCMRVQSNVTRKKNFYRCIQTRNTIELIILSKIMYFFVEWLQVIDVYNNWTDLLLLLFYWH